MNSKKISPYALAAIIIPMRIFALSMYVPSNEENAAITATVTIMLTALKLVSFIPLFILWKKSGGSPIKCGKAAVVFSALICIIYLLMITDGFSTAIESVYPDRFGKIGITAVFLFICGYVASMNINGISRASAISIFAITATILIILFEMRSNMMNEQIHLYSDEPLKEIISTIKNLLAFSGDYFIFFSLLPYIDSSPEKAAGIYTVFDMLLSTVFFMMSASIMGGYWSRSGFAYYTIAYCTHGEFIDRSDGLFLAIATVCGLISAAVFMGILKKSIKYIFNLKSDTNIYLSSAAGLTLIALCFISFNFKPARYSVYISVLSISVLFLASVIGLIFRRRQCDEKEA